MKTILILILLIIPFSLSARVHSVDEWVKRYLSECPEKPNGRVCYDKTKRNFKRMLRYKKMIFKKLDDYNLPRWLATIPFIESDYTENAISKAGAIGLWQLMPSNVQFYLTKRRVAFGIIITTMPTFEGARKKAVSPKLNTEIACKMLKHLYEKYGKDEHETVVQAYNAGETRIDCLNPKTKKKAKYCDSIGLLKKPLKSETLNYFKQLMALQILINGYEEYFGD